MDTAPVPTPSSAPAGDLTERERAILAFERQWWKHAGHKDAAVREALGLSSTHYYALLNGLIDRPEALEHDTLLVRRLRRQRLARQRARSSRRVRREG